MQCYEYLAMQRYARRHLGRWTEKYGDLELAEVLDEQGVRDLQDVKRIDAGPDSA
jgi:hypothetical protein